MLFYWFHYINNADIDNFVKSSGGFLYNVSIGNVLRDGIADYWICMYSILVGDAKSFFKGFVPIYTRTRDINWEFCLLHFLANTYFHMVDRILKIIFTLFCIYLIVKELKYLCLSLWTILISSFGQCQFMFLAYWIIYFSVFNWSYSCIKKNTNHFGYIFLMILSLVLH